jgi:dihydrofolate reductase
MAKYVFSQTLTDPGSNTTVVRDDVATAIRNVVARSRHGVVAFGGPRFAATLMRLGLVDDDQLFVHPVALGDGTPLFAGVTGRHQLRLVTTRTYGDTVVAIRYASAAPRRAAPRGS